MSLEAHHRFILDTMQRNQDIARNIINGLEAENARLKADAQLVVKHLGEACADNLRLKADVVKLADALKLASDVGIKVADEVTRLKAEVERLRNLAIKFDGYLDLVRHENERLRKAGDAMVLKLPDMMAGVVKAEEALGLMNDWIAAKEGKQP